MDIIIAEGHGFVSNLIKLVIRSPFSHAALRYSGGKTDWLIHSTRGGVIPEWWFYFKENYTLIQVYKCNFPEADLAANNLTKRIGHKGYGYFTVIGAGIEILLGYLGIKIKNPFPNPLSFTCSEIIPEFFIECNELNPDLNLDTLDDEGEYSESITPPQILNYLESRKDLFTRVEYD